MENLPDKVALIGAPGAGKTALAKAYAAKFGVSYADTDEIINARFGGVNACFARSEQYFREVEEQAVKLALSSEARIISCGGGAVLSKANMAELRKSCIIVRVTAPLDKIRERNNCSDRPLKDRLETILIEREPLYRKYADFTVSDGGVSELVAALDGCRGNRYDIMLVDSDDTLLDFNKAMTHSILDVSKAFGVKKRLIEILRAFKEINDSLWSALERGEITRAELLSRRFELFCARMGGDLDPVIMSEVYIEHMCSSRYMIDGALDFLSAVRGRGIKVYVVTNSFARVAKRRLTVLDGHVDGIFVSENLGYDKPDVRYFELVHRSLGYPDKNRIILFGDSVSSDIAGAQNFGVDSCLFDREGKKVSTADYTVDSYEKLLSII